MATNPTKKILAARLASALVAAEYGYKAAERGDNLQKCLSELRKIWNESNK